MAHRKLIGTRKEHNIHQSEMADVLDISETSYGAKERQDQQFKIEEINKMLELFPNKKYEDLF